MINLYLLGPILTFLAEDEERQGIPCYASEKERSKRTP